MHKKNEDKLYYNKRRAYLYVMFSITGWCL